jgi:hypothetical protein
LLLLAQALKKAHMINAADIFWLFFKVSLSLNIANEQLSLLLVFLAIHRAAGICILEINQLLAYRNVERASHDFIGAAGR